jgi:hypothetical protein
MNYEKPLSVSKKDFGKVHFLTWHELSVLTLCLVSLTGMGLLVGSAFSPFSTLLFAVIPVLLTCKVLHLKFPSRLPVFSLPVFFSLVLGLLLRLEQWPNLSGGQDQGLYTNMSSAFTHSGGVTFVDNFRAGLPSGMQTVYDQARLLSVGLVDRDLSLFTIEFYPLHPLWMAIGNFLFGSYGRHISLLLFSLIGLSGAYKLALEIDGRKKVAQLFLALLSLNPALVFFTKFPVTEIVASAFAINGFLFFLRYVRSESLGSRRFNLVLMILAFLCLGVTRWQVILYTPFLIALFGASLLPILSWKVRSRVLIAVSSILATLVCSLLYYYWVQQTLFTAASRMIRGSLPSATTISFAFLVSLCGLFVFRYFLSRGILEKITKHKQSSLLKVGSYGILIFSFLLSIPSLINLYKTGITPRGYSVPLGDLYLFRLHSFYRLVLFASPVALALLFVSPFVTKKRQPLPLLVCYLFGALLWAVMLSRPIVPYLYYYGRYLVVDMLPLILFLASVACVNLGEHKSKLLMRMSYGSMLIYALLFSFLQLGHAEGEPQNTYEEFADLVQKEDILLLPILDQRLAVPLRVTFERSVFVASDALQTPLLIEGLQDLASDRGGRLILATFPSSAPIGLSPFAEIETTDCYFTNTDHFRGGLHRGVQNSKRRFLLPTTWACNPHPYLLFDLSKSYKENHPLIKNAALEGFFNHVPANPALVISSVDQASGTFNGLTSWIKGVEVLHQVPQNAVPCFAGQLCTEQGQSIYILQVIRRFDGQLLILVPPSEGAGTSTNPLISMDNVRLFGASDIMPSCNLNLPTPGGDVQSLHDGWIEQSCKGAPALLSTYVEWLSNGCTNELNNWYICSETSPAP